MTAQLTKIKNTAGVQAVLNAGFGAGTGDRHQELQAARHQHAAVPVARRGLQGVHQARRRRRRGRAPAGGGLLVAESLPASDPQKPVVVAYKQDYEARFKQDISTFGGHAYDGLMLAVEAMKKAGSHRQGQGARCARERPTATSAPAAW